MIVKLIGKCLLLLLIVLLIVESVVFFSPFKQKDLETDFAAAIIDKQEILKKTPSPKIVLIGGSSVAYGIDSKLMADSLGIPVINMSYQYFLGSDFLFKQIIESLNEGDKVIASFEYIVTKEGDKKEQMKAAHYYPKARDWIVFESPIDFISSWLRMRIELFRLVIWRLFFGQPFEPSISDKTNIFFRKAIDERGDLVSHLNNDPIKFEVCETSKDTIFYSVIENINYYTETLKSKNIDVYFSFPPYEENSFENDKEVIDLVFSQFKNTRQIKLLDSPHNRYFPNTYFQDMCYHLNDVGRKQRTLKLIKDFKNTVQENAL